MSTKTAKQQTRARSQKDKEEKRQMLMAAAKELFIERGYKSPTVEMITERAGLSVGTFYLYFQGKFEIYKVFQNEGVEILSGMIFEALTGDYTSAREKLLAAAGAYLRFYREYPEYYSFIAMINLGGKDELRESKSQIGRLIKSATIAILRRVQQVIAEGIRTGELRPADPWKTACVLWAMVDGFVLMEERNNTRLIGINLDELITFGLESAFSGVTARTVSTSEDALVGNPTSRYRRP